MVDLPALASTVAVHGAALWVASLHPITSHASRTGCHLCFYLDSPAIFLVRDTVSFEIDKAPDSPSERIEENGVQKRIFRRACRQNSSRRSPSLLSSPVLPLRELRAANNAMSWSACLAINASGHVVAVEEIGANGDRAVSAAARWLRFEATTADDPSYRQVRVQLRYT